MGLTATVPRTEERDQWVLHTRECMGLTVSPRGRGRGFAFLRLHPVGEKALLYSSFTVHKRK